MVNKTWGLEEASRVTESIVTKHRVRTIPNHLRPVTAVAKVSKRHTAQRSAETFLLWALWWWPQMGLDRRWVVYMWMGLEDAAMAASLNASLNVGYNKAVSRVLVRYTERHT